MTYQGHVTLTCQRLAKIETKLYYLTIKRILFTLKINEILCAVHFSDLLA